MKFGVRNCKEFRCRSTTGNFCFCVIYFFSMLTSTNRPSVAQQFSELKQKIRTQHVYDDNGVVVRNAELSIRDRVNHASLVQAQLR